jgi:S-adenosylmethionine:tRNA ribosyltransferase-isomerase
MRVDAFDFELPEDRIALRPVSPRDTARLLVVHGAEFGDRHVRDLPKLLQPGDLMVFNDTRVLPAALEGIRSRGEAEARIHSNLHKRVDQARWKAFVRPAKRLRPGDVISFWRAGSMRLSSTWRVAKRSWRSRSKALFWMRRSISVVRCRCRPTSRQNAPWTHKTRTTISPYLPEKDGSVASPTASLHFTSDLMDSLAERGVDTAFLTLHVGAGTFLPVKADDTDDHAMHAEFGVVPDTVVDAVARCRARGGQVIAVGTTVLRLLETAADGAGGVKPWSGETDIFITPGFAFHAVDVLMTNFHLPRSTLFMLVSAFCGLETMKSAYAHAIEAGYRFYSYGDASLLFRSQDKQARP